MYDYFAEPDEEEIAKKQTKSLTKSPKADSAPVSPKQKKEEPINLLKSNIETKGRKKNAPLSPGKHTKNELETAIANVSGKIQALGKWHYFLGEYHQRKI